MKAETARVVAGLQRAMQAEVEGYYFYKMAAQSTSDPQGREVFEELADEGQQHFEFLRDQLAALE